ncbi:MAG: hypothetical protein Q8P23_03540 [bacterium]|nr:hypothetical protein [bacterium]
MFQNIVAMLCAVFLLAGCWTPVDPKGNEGIRLTLQKCRDSKMCIGGFVKFKGENTVYRIDSSCSFTHCDGYATRWQGLVEPELNLTISRIEYVALPYDQPRGRWDEAALEYARQFVIKR